MKQLKDGDIDEITAKNQYETQKEFYVSNSI